MDQPLGAAGYRHVVVASGLANLADGIRLAAFPLLAVATNDSPAAVAVVFAAGEAPWVVLGLWAGNLTDRIDRRRLVRAVTLARTILLVGLAGLIAADSVSIGLVAVAAFVLGTSEVLADNVMGALVPSLVPPEHLERANSRMVAVKIVGNELVGPAIGGLLFAVGSILPFLTNAGLLAVAFLLLAGVPLVRPAADAGEPRPRADALRGARYIRASPVLRTVTWSSMVLIAADSAWIAILVVFVEQQLGLGSAAFGLFLAIGAAGGLAGTVFADRRPGAALARVALFVFASMAASLVLLGALPNPAVTAVALIVTSAGFAVWNVFMLSARQRATPSELLGRVGAAFMTVVVLASLGGALAGGLLAELTSLSAVLIACGVVVGVLTPIVTVRFRRLTAAA